MRILLFSLLTVISFCCSAQPLLKSIYDPTRGFLYRVSLMQNIDSTYTVFTKNDELITMQLDNSGNILWTKRVLATGIKLDEDMGVDRISDSTFIIVSSCYYTEYVFDVYLAKVNKSGQAIWIKSIGSTSNTEYGHNVKCTADGGFIIAGEKWIGSVDPAEVYLVKTDSNGNTQWSKGFNRVRMDKAFDVIETNNGFVTAGTTDSIATEGSFGLLIKTDKLGNTMWSKGYGAPLSFVKSIIRDGDVFILAGGSTMETYIGDQPTGDAVLLKTDSLGNPIWTKQYHFDIAAYATKVIKTIDGGYLLLGMLGGYIGLPSEASCFFIKTDNNGNIQWSKIYGGRAQGYYGTSLFQKPDGNVTTMVEYFTNADVLLMFNTDSLGNGSGVCEVSTTPIVYSPSTLDSNFVFTETFYNDSAVTVPFSISQDSLVAVDSCNVSPLGVIVIPKLAVNLYPNPSTGIINIEATLSDYEIEISNAVGVKVYSQKANANKTTINIIQYPKGFYICSVKSHDKIIWTRAFILR